MLANRNLAEADQATKIAITNAQNFLQMDMANLSNDQQVAVLNAQMAQQAMLSDLAAENAAAQFSAANQQQADQYTTSPTQHSREESPRTAQNPSSRPINH